MGHFSPHASALHICDITFCNGISPNFLCSLFQIFVPNFLICLSISFASIRYIASILFDNLFRILYCLIDSALATNCVPVKKHFNASVISVSTNARFSPQPLSGETKYIIVLMRSSIVQFEIAANTEQASHTFIILFFRAG